MTTLRVGIASYAEMKARTMAVARERVMIGKTDGKVADAVLSFGGFMGMGNDYYPVPWSQLTYDTRLGGYRTKISRDQFEGAPKYSGDDWDWEDRSRGRQVYEYYGAPWVGY